MSGQGSRGLDIPADQDRMLFQSASRSKHARGARASRGMELRVLLMEGAGCQKKHLAHWIGCKENC